MVSYHCLRHVYHISRMHLRNWSFFLQVHFFLMWELWTYELGISSSTTTKKKVQILAIFLSWLFKAIILTGMDNFFTFTCAGNKVTLWLSHCLYHSLLNDGFSLMVSSQRSVLNTSMSSFKAVHRAKYFLRGKCCPLPLGHPEMEKLQTCAEELHKVEEEVGIETYIAFARPKLCIFQNTSSEWKCNSYMLVTAEICFLTTL